MKSWLRFAFSVIKLSAKQLEAELHKYRLWTIPSKVYPNISFSGHHLGFFSSILNSRLFLKNHHNLVEKAGFYISSHNAHQLSESQLMVFANIDFEQGKSPLTKPNVQHIIKVSISRKDVSIITKLLLCLKSTEKVLIAYRLVQQRGDQILSLKQQDMISALILLHKCYKCEELQDVKMLISPKFVDDLSKLKGKGRLVADAMLHSLGVASDIDIANAIKLLEQDELPLEIIYSLFIVKDELLLNDNQLSSLFHALFNRLPYIDTYNSWMVVSIFSRLSTLQKLFIIGQLPANKFHVQDYVLYLEILELSELEVQIKGNHLLPLAIKSSASSQQFERVLTLRFSLRYDDESSLPQIFTRTFSKDLVCFKGLLRFLSTLEVQSELIYNMISKKLAQIIKNSEVTEYDIVQFYNCIGLLAKHQLCKNKFWRGVQDYLIANLQQAIEISHYISTFQREQFLSNLVLLLKNHYGKSKMEEMVLNQLKLSLNQLWSIKGLEDMASNLGIVGVGDNEVWRLIEENIQMMRKEGEIAGRVAMILKVMVKLNKGSGYFWRRMAESLPPIVLQDLKAQAVILQRKTISKYIQEGQGRRQKAKSSK